MIVVKCAWCQKVMKTIQTNDDYEDGLNVSHGICKKCLKKHFNLPKRKEKNEG